MGLTINPAVSGGRRRWLGRSAAFFVGVFFGGLLTLAGLLALVAVADHVLPIGRLAVVAAAAIAWAVLHDLGFPLPLPYRNRQVPEWLREVLPQSVVAAIFGGMLGIGFLTLFTYSTQLAVFLALPFLGSVAGMLGVVAIFAIGRTMVLASVARARSLDEVPVYWDATGVLVLRMATAAVSLTLVW
jgi:hypothetical protein